MALAWNLRQKSVTSVLVGASRLSQLQESVRMMDNLDFSPEEELKISSILLLVRNLNYPSFEHFLVTDLTDLLQPVHS